MAGGGGGAGARSDLVAPTAGGAIHRRSHSRSRLHPGGHLSSGRGPPEAPASLSDVPSNQRVPGPAPHTGWEPNAARWASGTPKGHPTWEPILPSAFRVHLNVLLSRSRHQGPPAPCPLGCYHLPPHHRVRTTSPGAHSARSPGGLESRGGVTAGLGAPGRAEEPGWCGHPAKSRKHKPEASA